jgi:hypothetical protein
MDEDGICFKGEPMDEGTSIIVEGEEFAKCLDNHNEYFLGDREPIVTSKNLDVFDGKGVIYYRGVKIGEVKEASHSYHIKDHIELTEDRTFKYEHTLYYKIGSAIVKEITDKKFLKSIILKKTGWEAQLLDYDWDWSESMKETVCDLWALNPGSMNDRIQALVPKYLKTAKFRYTEPTEDQQSMIAKALEFLEKAGYKVNHPIRIANCDDSNTIAYAYDGEIILTERAFSKGLHLLLVAIFEESHHCIGYSDFNRAFQTYLIEEVISNARKRIKEVF